jgi:pimeloyl-ACP methyl ester carboxylesterase
METVRHDGRETAYRHVRPGADGPTTLYVHGSGATGQVWASQYGPDGPAHPAVAVDLSGHGDSTDLGETGPEESGETEVEETIRAYAADACAVARATDAEVLVGNSLGGAVVLAVLLERDLPVEAAVLAGSGAKLAVADRLREWLADDFEAAIEFLHGPDRLFHDPDPQVVERSTATMGAVGRRVTERDFLACHAFDVRERLGEVGVPVLALVGAYDELTPPAYHEYLAANVQDGTMGVIENAAHLAMVEQPTAFNAALAAFLGRTVRSQ